MKITELNIEKRAEKHLELRDILEFVSASVLNDRTEKNAVLVTTHIRSCRKCLETVRDFQALYDELRDMDKEQEFEQTALQVLQKDKILRNEQERSDPFKD